MDNENNKETKRKAQENFEEKETKIQKIEQRNSENLQKEENPNGDEGQKKDKSQKKNVLVRRKKNRVKSYQETSEINPEVLVYLEKFEKKENWKFNKNLQTELLEHILNAKKIPKGHFKYALNYVTGLKGVARSRLIEKCKNATRVQKEKEKYDLSDEENEEKLQEALKSNKIYSRANTILQILETTVVE